MIKNHNHIDNHALTKVRRLERAFVDSVMRNRG